MHARFAATPLYFEGLKQSKCLRLSPLRGILRDLPCAWVVCLAAPGRPWAPATWDLRGYRMGSMEAGRTSPLVSSRPARMP
jgi:hypothetical protein